MTFSFLCQGEEVDSQCIDVRDVNLDRLNFVEGDVDELVVLAVFVDTYSQDEV